MKPHLVMCSLHNLLEFMSYSYESNYFRFWVRDEKTILAKNPFDTDSTVRRFKEPHFSNVCGH
jgi:hypothetical protein